MMMTSRCVAQCQEVWCTFETAGGLACIDLIARTRKDGYVLQSVRLTGESTAE